jgi:hypothetical protein
MTIFSAKKENNRRRDGQIDQQEQEYSVEDDWVTSNVQD